MKQFLPFTLTLIFIIGVTGQYGIPDDDESSPSAPVPSVVRTSRSVSTLKFETKKPSYEQPQPELIKTFTASPNSKEVLEIKKMQIPIVKFLLDDDNLGTFTLETVSGDGTAQNSQGSLKNLGDPEGPVSVMKGSYSFVGDDKKTYSVQWKADENGFQAFGSHLPVPSA